MERVTKMEGLISWFKWVFKGEQEEKKKVSPLHERRKYRRIPSNMVVTSYKIPDYRTITKDISFGGIRLSLSSPIPKGETVELTLEIDSKFGRRNLRLKGEVVWVKRVSPRKYEAGLKFVELSEPQKNALRTLLRELVARRNVWEKRIEFK